jgi:hypothetical protein
MTREQKAAALVFDEMHDALPHFSLAKFVEELRYLVRAECGRLDRNPRSYSDEERNYWDDTRKEEAAQKLGGRP